ncbi:MAG: hypothetical protein ACE5IC_01295 [Candidatus Brocadiales bacterium]
MCRQKLVRCFILVLMTCILEAEAWGEPFSEKAAAGLLSIAAEEGSNGSTTQEQESDEGYSETEEYDEEGIMEEEFPEDEWEEEETDREAAKEVALGGIEDE